MRRPGGVLSRTGIAASLIAVLVGAGPAITPAAAQAIPKHLAIARELVENTRPEDNHYVLGGESISFPGDLFSDKYAVRADCSGFLLAIFARARYPTRSRMGFLGQSLNRKRPAAEDFVFSIETEQGFKRIVDVRQVQPGDLLAHAMLQATDRQQTGTTGHVFLVDSAPRAIAARPPIVEATQQYEISVIDSNEEWVGADDTRLADPANKLKGLGRGTIRVYADGNGQLVGWARTFGYTNRFFSYDPRFPSDTKLRKAAIGRPVTGT